MAELTISLRRDPTTGKQDIHISLRSDEDALPHEHEEMHRQLVEKLVGQGVLNADDVGKVVVEREQSQKQPASPTSSGPEGERRAADQGN
ncbi:hypothetical protein [Tuwongella immobilis]|uniref:FtsH ternary system domain-containing protein n=1 Tax=Tuwongella immobilis TaxID=692036 RepID=A0A6C2YKT4_9BACT|nr:hypothetical protein [Tuwongella immobilis]VIP01987.1 Uncharacterized protein OS=Cystobacter fuscus DSM 2262 GN=D187_003963 PE=4 SV=1 [Tuwongella immobilis]VTS00048.1 Uncharacterized protein OS=Cystobacter fuscus DSM 2262 GN=D187_003963 PE=4 SV=1 [Tuwongella immobilis]